MSAMHPHIEVESLSVDLPEAGGIFPIVRQAAFEIGEGEVLGIIGESGSGKSLTALSLLGLLDRPLVASGHLGIGSRSFRLNDVAALKCLRGCDIGMIFQDPAAALNPVRTVGAHFTEILRRHRSGREMALRREVLSLLCSVGIGDGERRLSQYPHQLSGGLCQRVTIALALTARPRLLIADEPTTALDTTVQAQVLDLIDDIRDREGMSILFISHDLAVVGDIADRVAVMRQGEIVETAARDVLFSRPRSDYARSLIALDADKRGISYESVRP